MSVSIMLALQSSGSVSYNTYLVLKYKSGPLSHNTKVYNESM